MSDQDNELKELLMDEACTRIELEQEMDRLYVQMGAYKEGDAHDVAKQCFINLRTLLAEKGYEHDRHTWCDYDIWSVK